jgi:Ca-activated chloride channel homolog
VYQLMYCWSRHSGQTLARMIAGGLCALAIPLAANPQIFRSSADLVVLHVNVFDGKSDAVPDLPQSAFQIFEEGKPQEIAFFSGADVPVAAGLLVDNSGSMITRQALVVAGGLAFAESSHPEDELFVLQFNELVRYSLPAGMAFTNDQQVLRSGLARYPAGGKTALHDAVIEGIDHLEQATHQKHVGR